MAVDIARIDRLRRMRWSELERAALEAGISVARIRAAATRDELRLAILAADTPDLEEEPCSP